MNAKTKGSREQSNDQYRFELEHAGIDFNFNLNKSPSKSINFIHFHLTAIPLLSTY